MKKRIKNNIEPWTLYWQKGYLQSCIALKSQQDVELLPRYWQQFIAEQNIHSNTQLLDLATGHGAVPDALVQTYPALSITAIDYAQIDRHKIVSALPHLNQVNFLSGIDMAQLPFENQSFDIITSQFGFEYANIDKAVGEIARVLKLAGQLQLIVHHQSSDIVKTGQRQHKELTQLLAEQGLILQLHAFLLHRISADDLQQSTELQFAKGHNATKVITGQVINIIDYFIQNAVNNTDETNMAMFNEMQINMQAEQARLTQLTHVAFDETNMLQLQALFAEQDISTKVQVITTIDKQLIIGWQIRGEKLA